jgi:hypothetical protein
MSSATSDVRQTLEGYVAGRVKAERLVEVVTAAYYGRDAGTGMRDALRPVIGIIERAHPGVIELSGTAGGPGFAVRLADRPFPKRFEAALRGAAETVLVGAQHAAPLQDVPPARTTGLVARLLQAVRRLFTAST